MIGKLSSTGSETLHMAKLLRIKVLLFAIKAAMCEFHAVKVKRELEQHLLTIACVNLLLPVLFLRSGKKRLFPRFHFTSEADLLDILSNGNQPSKIMRHIDKLMLSTSTLALETVPGNVSNRPRAVHFEAAVGDEIISFEPAVFLEGKVPPSSGTTATTCNSCQIRAVLNLKH